MKHGDEMHEKITFNENPLLVTWEMTRACELQCRHCRVEAEEDPHREELSFEEGKNLIDQIEKMNRPLLILTGGDCMRREDLFDLVAYAVNKGIRVELAPGATSLLTKEKLQQAKDTGVAQCNFSLDGPTPEIHDHFRGSPNSFDQTIKKIHMVNKLGLPLQINTAITRYNYGLLEDMAKLVAELKAVTWHIYPLVPTHREQIEDCVTAPEHEKLFEWLYQLEKTAPFTIQTAASQHYRRVVLQQETNDRHDVNIQMADVILKKDQFGKTAHEINDGNGSLFISHIGQVFPSELLRLSVGNIKETPLKDIYQHADVFKMLRQPDTYKGKCGKCEYRYMCGGSRARAFAVTGDYLASEPFCVYVPEKIRAEMKAR